MGQITWRDVSKHWSLLFTAAVALWFLVAAINVPNLDVSNPLRASEEPASAAPVNVSSSTTVQVQSFHVDAGPPVTGEMTLQVRNESSSRMTFRPESLILRPIGGSNVMPLSNTPPVEVAAGRSVIVPVSFPVRLGGGTNYELTYVGNAVFTGRPLPI